ncbi:alanine--tRNA ligase [Gallalistipes aquisgranensis]|uniref:alanine--tRNA ligase n=1 Tax=Gallalistipes aquisgranensis TaxID=2779358 RepID=UPI001CF8FE9B|nr:alanine--tRNA ligase [Gallalistipes aquisgranensis]MBE5032947.1 alanine--tRNA ligase [Gallalistipes aquisgranensis]
MESNQIREAFLEFFRSKGHQIVPSAPMVVKNDPTLMFTNAGMNQFKDKFLGNSPITSKRVADTQKCLRVSGKHNDLEEVGHDTYHHTMFEMLGNWSFGDYFKKEAISWAWELLTEVYKLPKERLYATIFEGSEEDGVPRDQEAYDYWLQFLPADHIILGNKHDNFWEMGDTGPCGPCSEIHFDLRSDGERAVKDGRELVNAGHHLVIEIWNLVFMQFNRKANGSLEPLPAHHVDTGMGFERLCMILQGKQSNYDTDVFQPAIREISEMSGKKYGDDPKADVAMRVIADHLRAIAFSIADGQLPSNVKAGYVIRRILRRAVRYGYTYLGFTEPFICRLVDGLAERMGGQFPELVAQKALIKSVIEEEESAFLRTLATGISLLDSVIRKSQAAGGKTISGADAFLLYDTYGFPIDLTELIAREQGMEVDLDGFDRELQAQKARSRNAAAVDTDDWVEVRPVEESRFVGYDSLECEVRIARYRRVTTKGKSYYQLVFDATPFYGNSGGQAGDTGYIEYDGERIAITDTQKENNLTVHIADKLPADPSVLFRAVVNRERRAASANNHTATHLMHEALREVLGTHVEQKGSLVTADYLRFDFSHFQKVTDEQLREVEKRVNAKVRANYPLEEQRECPIEKARELGAMMLFGEKYGDKVRVVKFGSSVEFCGGTHVSFTGNIGLFKILSESATSAGVRRIEAVTGARAEEYVYGLENTLKDVQQFVNNPSVTQAVKKILEDNTELHKELDELRREKLNSLRDKVAAELKEEDGMVLCAREINLAPAFIKDMAFALKPRFPRLVMVIGSNVGGKATLTVMLGDEIVAQGVNASQVIREAAKEINGGGGGQPFFATAGGKNPEGMEKAILKAVDMIKEKLK